MDDGSPLRTGIPPLEVRLRHLRRRRRRGGLRAALTVALTLVTLAWALLALVMR